MTTVFDLLMAQYAVPRDGLPGEWPAGYDDAASPGTPAWQEPITSVPAAAAARVAREFARNAELSKGRSMIAMGAGTNHWFHSDEIYRTFLTLIMLCGCQGVNGGGWAHYVGQEKVRPLAGWQQVAFALDWQRPPRHMTGTSFFYLHTDQWRYEQFGAGRDGQPARPGPVHRARRSRTAWRRHPAWAGPRRTPRSTVTRLIFSMSPNGPGFHPRTTSSPSCGRDACGSPPRTRMTRRTGRGC